jgi:class 3 adenylate cyclase/predicted ATPase
VRAAEALKHYQDLSALLKRELSVEPDAATKSLVAEVRSAHLRSRSPNVEGIVKPALPRPDPPSIAALPIREPSNAAAGKENAESPAVPRNAASSAVAVRSDSPERRQLTIMVCQVLGSTPLSAGLDPEDMRDWIAPLQKAVADAVARFDGYVAQYLGDGAVIYFGYPAAHENDAEQAVRAGLAILDAISTLKASPDPALRARVGIATGLVVVGEQLGIGNTQQPVAVGETPNLATQLQAVAAPGQVVIAASTRRLVGRMFDCRPLAASELKGLPQSVGAWQVRGEVAGVGRFEALRTGALSALVGRQEEMELLRRRWDQAKAGEGRVVLLSGEPGIGKSRIAEGLLAKLEGEPHTRIRYFCSPHHANSPLHPLIAHIERAAGFEPDSSTSAKLDMLEALLKATAKNFPQDLALIADLLSVPTDGRYPALAVPPQRKREMTLTALLDQLGGIAAQSPVLIVFEDIHWIDPTSLDLLDRTVTRVADQTVLLVITARPEFQPTWVGLPHVTVLSLSRLGRRDSADIIDGVTKGKVLPIAVVNQVLAHADGVPLFIEELTSTLLESGFLREITDRYVLDGPLPPLAVPTSLQASLMARLDRHMEVKEIAQIGAAIGREFSHELIAQVAPPALADIADSLERLTASGLAFRIGTPPEATYTFKHALVQDAAYGSLLKSRRQELHRKIARVIDERFPNIKTTEPEVLAHHLTAAGLAEAAVPLWRAAAELSMRRMALAEAISHLTRGLEVTSTLPPSLERDASELDLRKILGTALIATKGFAAPEVEQTYARAQVLCRQMGDTPQIFPVLYGLWAFYLIRADMQAARELVEQLWQLARRADDSGLLVVGHQAMGETFHFEGEFVLAHEHVTRGIALYDPQQHSALAPLYGEHPGVVCQLFAAHGLWCLGYPDRALASVRDGITLARQLAHPVMLVEALDFAAWIHQCRREAQATREQAEASIALATEHEIVFFLAHATVIGGWALVELGQTTEGIDQIRQGLAAHRASGAVVPLPSVLLAEAYVKVGQPQEGLRVVAEALVEVHKGLRYYEAELYRLKGELLLGLSADNHADPETCFQQALTIARRQQTRSFELRAAMSLGRLWQRQGKHAAAHELVGGIYGWFSEGFETADLREAKALLEALA